MGRLRLVPGRDAVPPGASGLFIDNRLKPHGGWSPASTVSCWLNSKVRPGDEAARVVVQRAAYRRISHRLTDDRYRCCFFCSASRRSFARSPPRMFVIA